MRSKKPKVETIEARLKRIEFDLGLNRRARKVALDLEMRERSKRRRKLNEDSNGAQKRD